MKARLPLVVLLASALAFLVSLYLQWETSAASSTASCSGPRVQCLLQEFTGGGVLSWDGWDQFGQVAGLLALGLAAGAVASIVRPRLANRLPLASCAFALGVFAVLSLFEIRNAARVEGTYGHVVVQVAFGSYLGLASATLACVCAIVLRRAVFERGFSLGAAVGATLTAGMLAAFLGQLSLNAFDETLPIFIVGAACLGLPLWSPTGRAAARLAVAVAIAVLTGGYLNLFNVARFVWPWELWLLLGCSLGLVALAVATARGLRLSRPSAPHALVFIPGALLIVALFLPWERFASSTSGWSMGYSATAGGLAVALLALLLTTARFSGALVVGVAIYVMGTGFDITEFTGLRYGAPLGFAGAALLLVWVLRSLAGVNAERLLVRVLPILASAAFLAIPVLALTRRPSFWFVLESPWRLYWLEVAAILVALFLLGRWLTSRRDDLALVVLPFALLALTTLDLIEYRGEGISWLGIASVCLCLLLAGFGWIERRSGLETFRIPEEIWRVDRLPGEN